jgi:hypothetical protein
VREISITCTKGVYFYCERTALDGIGSVSDSGKLVTVGEFTNLLEARVGGDMNVCSGVSTTDLVDYARKLGAPEGFDMGMVYGASQLFRVKQGVLRDNLCHLLVKRAKADKHGRCAHCVTRCGRVKRLVKRKVQKVLEDPDFLAKRVSASSHTPFSKLTAVEKERRMHALAKKAKAASDNQRRHERQLKKLQGKLMERSEWMGCNPKDATDLESMFNHANGSAGREHLDEVFANDTTGHIRRFWEQQVGSKNKMPIPSS